MKKAITIFLVIAVLGLTVLYNLPTSSGANAGSLNDQDLARLEGGIRLK